MTTMNAIRLHEFGGPEVLRYETVPIPEPGPGEVLVRVHAVGVNPPDWYLRDGYEHQHLPADLMPSIPLPAIPGSDVSGVVEAVAPDVRRLRRRRRRLRHASLSQLRRQRRLRRIRLRAGVGPGTQAGRRRPRARRGRPDVGADRVAVPDRGGPRRTESASAAAASAGAARRQDGVWSTAPRAASGTSPCSWRSGGART